MWYKIIEQKVSLTIVVKPNAKKSAIVDFSEKELKISLHAKPKQGEANEELISYLAKLLRLPKSEIVLQRGKGSRYKQVVMPLTDNVQQLLDDVSRFIII
jgi:uncharacterized protein (TIGR00251 family)